MMILFSVICTLGGALLAVLAHVMPKLLSSTPGVVATAVALLLLVSCCLGDMTVGVANKSVSKLTIISTTVAALFVVMVVGIASLHPGVFGW